MLDGERSVIFLCRADGNDKERMPDRFFSVFFNRETDTLLSERIDAFALSGAQASADNAFAKIDLCFRSDITFARLRLKIMDAPCALCHIEGDGCEPFPIYEFSCSFRE